jgi:uncharacterized membrane protein
MEANDHRSRAQKWADSVTEFSGSWKFIGWFAFISACWICINAFGLTQFDPYPFLFLNWILTVISTFQNPLILLSQNRQNEMDRERIGEILNRLDKILNHLEQNQ